MVYFDSVNKTKVYDGKIRAVREKCRYVTYVDHRFLSDMWHGGTIELHVSGDRCRFHMENISAKLKPSILVSTAFLTLNSCGRCTKLLHENMRVTYRCFRTKFLRNPISMVHFYGKNSWFLSKNVASHTVELCNILGLIHPRLKNSISSHLCGATPNIHEGIH